MLVSGNKNVVAAKLVADRPGLVELSVRGTAKCQLCRLADVPWRETLVTVEVASGAPIQVELSVDGLTLAAQSREEVVFFDERGKEQKSLDLAAWGNPR